MSGNQESTSDVILVYLQENAEFRFWKIVWVLPSLLHLCCGHFSILKVANLEDKR